MIRYRFILFLALICGNLLITPTHAASKASKLFGQLKQRVYQIRVVDIASDNKSSIGSGFQVSKDGHVATNFHVVASYVHKPKSYRLEAVNHNNTIDAVELLGIDVIHDLAILKLTSLRAQPFAFKVGKLSKGDRIYSMGNPHDLSMSIIEGNYNGLVKTSRYKKILFSGSLNAGMSGGPTFDGKGKIIGINVSKGSEQLSFLVPVKELDILLQRVLTQPAIKNFQNEIEISLLRDQDQFYQKLFSEKWKPEPFMELTIPGTISDSLKCWGHTADDKNLRYQRVHQHCLSQDEIYLDRSLVTGNLIYDYEWLSSNKLNRFQFYSLIQKRFLHMTLSNAQNKRHVSNFQCAEKTVEISQHAWRISSCVRAYRKYRNFYDTVLLLTSVDENHKAVVIKIGAAGISRSNATRLVKTFIESVQWPR